MDFKEIPLITKKLYNQRATDELVESVTIFTAWGLTKIPKGFKTDFASTPKALRGLVPQRGLYDLATLLHDFRYHTKEISRKEADDEQRDVMLKLGVPKAKAILIWSVVRIFGGERWKEL